MAHVSPVLLLLVLSCMAASVQGFNITAILDPFPNYSVFNEWLSSTGVVNEVNARTTMTVLATPNTIFQSYVSGLQNASFTISEQVADTLRYQVLLTYYGMKELNGINVNNHTSVTTLLQTTGRANDTGFVDIYNTGKAILVGHYVVDKDGNETVVGNVVNHPYDYSVLEISSVLIPLPALLPAPLGAPVFAPAPAPVKKPPSTPKSDPNPITLNSASMTRLMSLPLTLTALFVASIAVLL